MKIEGLRLKNYKIFKDLKLTDLPDMVVFLGANGSGKSTLLDAFGFLNFWNCPKPLIAGLLLLLQPAFFVKWKGRSTDLDRAQSPKEPFFDSQRTGYKSSLPRNMLLKRAIFCSEEELLAIPAQSYEKMFACFKRRGRIS